MRDGPPAVILIPLCGTCRGTAAYRPVRLTPWTLQFLQGNIHVPSICLVELTYLIEKVPLDDLLG